MSSQRLRLLILAPSPPTSSGAHGSAVVMASLARHLVDIHDVALVYLRAAHEPPADDEIRDRCEIVVEIPRKELGRRAARWQRIKGLAGGKPSWVAQLSGVQIRQALRDVASTWDPSLVHVHFPVMGQFLDALPGVPRVLIVYEPATERAREAVGGTGIRRALSTTDALAWRRFERAVVAACAAVVVLTERDRAAMSALGTSTPIVVIPLGTTIPEQPLNPIGSGAPNVLFFGNFGHAPNVDAARTLVRVWPRVQTREPNSVLELVGPNPPADLFTDDRSAVQVRGAVPDIVPYLDRASVVAAPLRQGGGMRVKVVETLAAGKALVASSLALEGLGGIDDAVVVADDDGSLADALARLLGDQDTRRKLARHARAFAEENLGWSRRVEDYVRLNEAIVAGRLPTAERDHQDIASESA